MKIQINDVRLAFPALFTPKVSDFGAAKFGAAFLFPFDSEAKKRIEDAIETVGKEKWAAKWPVIKKALIAGQKVCLKDGDIKAQYAGYEGNWFVNTSATAAPMVVDRDVNITLTERDGKPYGGCYVNASIDIWAQDNKFGQRVNATLVGVQFVRDGDAFGGGAKASANEFESLSFESADDLL
jgi:hypothetical protein